MGNLNRKWGCLEEQKNVVAKKKWKNNGIYGRMDRLTDRWMEYRERDVGID